MIPLQLTQTIRDGKLHTIPLVWNDAPYTPAPGELIIFTAKRNYQDDDADAIFQKVYRSSPPVLGGITISGTNALVQTVFDDTSSLTDSVEGVWDIQGQVSGESPKTLAGGSIVLSFDVTHSLAPETDIYTLHPPLPDTLGDVFDAPAGVALGSGRFVAVGSDGNLQYASGPGGIPTQGFVRAAYEAGRTALVEKSGSLNGLSGLAPGATYYLGANGLIFTTAPVSGIRQAVGTAINSTTLSVNILEPVYLA